MSIKTRLIIHSLLFQYAVMTICDHCIASVKLRKCYIAFTTITKCRLYNMFWIVTYRCLGIWSVTQSNMWTWVLSTPAWCWKRKGRGFAGATLQWRVRTMTAAFLKNRRSLWACLHNPPPSLLLLNSIVLRVGQSTSVWRPGIDTLFEGNGDD